LGSFCLDGDAIWWCTPKLFHRLNYKSKVKTSEGWRVGVHSLARSTSKGVEGRVGTSGWGLGWMTSRSIIHMDLYKPNNKLVNHSWNIFYARMNHGQTQTHKIHHHPDLGKATTSPLIVFYVLGHGASTWMSFCPETPNLGVSKFPKLGLLWLWRPIILCKNLRLRWGLKKNYSPLQELSKDMWHATWTQGNQGDS